MSKTLIAIPCMDQVDTPFCQCLLELKWVDTVRFCMVSSSLVYDSRNKLVEAALQGDFSHVLFIDSDMVFEPDMLEKMLADDVDMVCGIFVRRRPPFSPCLYKTLEYDPAHPDEKKYAQYLDYPKDALFEVDACGFGAVLIKVDAIREMLLEDKGCFSPLLGLGEDLSFCIRFKNAGKKIYCDSRIKVGHMARMKVDENTFIQTQQIREGLLK